MIEIATSLFILIGIVFLLAGSIGVLRLRDVYGRMHAAGKSSTLGLIAVMLASVVHFSAIEGKLSIKPLLITAFIFLTAPVSTHMIIKAAYFSGVKMWRGSVLNEMETTSPEGHKP